MTSHSSIDADRRVDSRSYLEPANRGWVAAFILSAGLGLEYLARLAINSVFPLLRQDLEITDFEIGLSATAFLWTYALLSPLAGVLGDRFPRRTVLFLSVASWSVITLLCGFATEVWHLLAARVLLAITQACFIPTAQALIADLHPPKTQAKAIGIFMAGCYIGIFSAGLPVAYLATTFGWRTMFLLVGVVSLCFSLLIGYLPRGHAGKDEAAEKEQPIWSRASIDSLRSLLRVPAFIGILLAFALSGAAYFILFTFLPLFIFENFGLSMENAAFQATFYTQAGALILNPIFGAFADKWSANTPRNRFFFASITAITALPALAVVGFGQTTILLIVGLLIFSVAMAGTDVSWTPMLSTVVSERSRATAYGVLNLSSCFAGGTVTIIGAAIMKYQGLGLLITSGGVMFGVLAISLAITGFAGVPKNTRDELLGIGELSPSGDRGEA